MWREKEIKEGRQGEESTIMTQQRDILPHTTPSLTIHHILDLRPVRIDSSPFYQQVLCHFVTGQPDMVDPEHVDLVDWSVLV